MIRRRKRPQKNTQPEPCLFSDEEMAEMLTATSLAPNVEKSLQKTVSIAEPMAEKEKRPTVQTSTPKVEFEQKPSVEPSVETHEEENTESTPYDEERMLQDMLMAMDLFDNYYNPSKVRLIAMESATLAQGGIHNGQIYELPAIPGRRFDGNQLTAIYYVSFARSFPSMIDRINLPLSIVYKKALQEYESN